MAVYSSYVNGQFVPGSGMPAGGASSVPNAPVTQQLKQASGAFTGTGAGQPQIGQIQHTQSPYAPPGWEMFNGDTYGGYQMRYTGTPSTPASGGTGAGGQSSAPGGTTAGSGGGAGAVTNPFSAGVPTPSSDTVSPTGAGSAQYSNPFFLSAQNSAVNAGNLSGNLASGNTAQAGNMQAGANTLQGGAGTVMNTAFDPQNALYNRTAQQLQDQVRVSEAGRGITMSPYGAGIEDKAMSDFNIDWQNAQLGRQVQGLGAAGTATNAAGTANTTAGNLGNMAVGQTQAVGQLPADTATAQQNQNIQAWIAYMNQANAATGLAQQNYPIQLAQQSMNNAGGVPYIPQNSNTFSLG